MTLTQIFLIWLVFINLFAIVIFAIDKYKAVNGKWRIKEATLLLVAFLGGALGAYAGMQLFRHKTQKPKFVVGVPLLFVLNVAMVVAAFVWVL